MKASAIDIELVKQLANLAKVGLSEEELKKFSDQLGDIVGYVTKVQQIKGVKKETDRQGGSLINQVSDNLRPDQPKQCLTQEAALANAPQKQDSYFKVKAVLE